LNRIAADADASRLTQTFATRLVDGLVGESSGTRHDADDAGLVYESGHDADLAFARRDDAGAVRTDEHGVRIMRAQRELGAQHISHRYAFGNASDNLDAGRRRFQNRIGRIRRRYIDHRRLGAGLLYRFAYGVEHRQAEMLLPALARRHAADHLGAVGDGLFGMKRSLFAGESLTNDFGVLINQYAHFLIP